jgi:hypothetical protein
MKNETTMEPIVGKEDEITFEKKVTSKIAHDDPLVEIIDPFDIYIDPDATSSGFGGNAKFMIQRKMMDISDLKV